MRRNVRALVVTLAAGLAGSAALPLYAQPAEPVARTAGSSTAPASAEPASDEAQLPPPASAPAPAPSRRVAVTAGLDFASAYLFRGLYQEDRGVIVPPFVDVGISVYEGDGALKSVTVNGGNWNSLHSGPSGSNGAWYEADYYGSVSFTIGNWTPGALFTSYTSPADVFGTVHELAAVVAYDDSASPFPLSPKATVAFELDGQADGGASQGTYLELGIGPEFALVDTGRYPVTLTVPVKLGLSLKDYYEGPTGSNRFGFVSLGGRASVPLAFLNGRTSWEVHGGIDLLWLGDNLEILNNGDRVKPIGVVGFSVTY